ncbi:hypothetical protein DICPUDRAFT_158851 [Dictyostelium purpureum]|uniref:Uncharacterized protein n=1 Tax=Dictyostelium purpureum TaxID=5786 RepID=F1A2N2_DICPU|nr:uncharacterized protein DICPUDRAFT_158851 [Dictyostelium purpureum]EGC29552.1 hypothetical protein DICPUDRAFT_158851 [Dictyostelium purpureum]|eukprot:XP_003293922.1 hypothetical protein DICPUDRAFT_158851 [Dictyostelium purpureum]
MSIKNNSFFIYKTKGNMLKYCFHAEENSSFEQILNQITKLLNINLKDTINTTIIKFNGEEIQLSEVIKKGLFMVSGCQNEEYEIKSIKTFASNLD